MPLEATNISFCSSLNFVPCIIEHGSYVNFWGGSDTSAMESVYGVRSSKIWNFFKVAFLYNARDCVLTTYLTFRLTVTSNK